MNAFRYVCIFSICFLTSCASHKITPEGSPQGGTETSALEKPAGKAETKTQASKITSWELSGALAARNKNKAWTASLDWVQHGSNQYQIRLFGPLGGGTVIIEKNGGVVTYADGPKKVSSHNADTLLQQQTGVRLPVQNLYYWVRGLPAPGAVQSARYDQNNHLTSLTQAGYSIHYSSYTSVGGVGLPGKIHLEGHGVTVKLVVKHWKA